MDRRKLGLHLYQQGIKAMQSERFVREAIHCSNGLLSICGLTQQLRAEQKVFLFSCGKAAISMGRTALVQLGARVAGGLVITPEECDRQYLAPLSILTAAHPIPDSRSLHAGQQILTRLSELNESDIFIVLLSGGSSALMELPTPPLTLQDLQNLNHKLLNSSLTIRNINAVRKHLSLIKGGRLALATKAVGFVLVMSDVIGDDLSVIGSAPFYCDSSTFEECRHSLQAASLWYSIDPQIRDVLQRGEAGGIPETPKQPPSHISHHIISSNLDMLSHIQQRTREQGLNCHIVTTSLCGNASDVGGLLVGIAHSIQTIGEPFPPPVCLLCGGETTVAVRSDGTGGRNQELALSALLQIQRQPGIYLLCAASDGIDGNSDSAGAWVDHTLYSISQSRGLVLTDFLASNNSGEFFRIAQSTIPGGHTGVNVMDLTLMIVDPSPS